MYNFEKQLKIYHEIGIAVMLRGLHGIGKSERVEHGYARKNDYHFEPLFLSQQEVGDLIGIPYPDENHIQHWTKPSWLHRLEKASEMGIKGVLFLDEYNRAPLDVRQASMQLVLAKKIHEHSLPSDTLVVSAINPSDADYQVFELDPANNDRFVIHDLTPNADEFLKWADENNIHPLVKNFIAENPDRLWWKTDSEIESNHPTNRGWTWVSKYISSSLFNESSKDEQIILLSDFLSGKIGKTVGAQFLLYWKEKATFDILKILKPLKKDFRTKENIQKAIDILKPYTSQMEIIQIQNLTLNLINEYVPKTKNKNSDGQNKFIEPKKAWDICYPLMALLYSLDLEILHSVLKTLRDDEKQFENYSGIANADNFASSTLREKELWKKILEKIRI